MYWTTLLHLPPSFIASSQGCETPVGMIRLSVHEHHDVDLASAYKRRNHSTKSIVGSKSTNKPLEGHVGVLPHKRGIRTDPLV